MHIDFNDFYQRLLQAEWTEGDFDGEPILMADVGGVACTVLPNRTPIEWSTVIIPLDDAVGGGHFVAEGTAGTVQGAKDLSMNLSRVRALVRQAMAFLLGEIELKTGPSVEPPLRPQED